MEHRRDFVELLSTDVSTSVLMHLDNPADLVRASVVSRNWLRFVILNGLCKKLFMRMHPEAPNFMLSTEERHPRDSEKTNCSEWEVLEKEHTVYAMFVHLLRSPISLMNCIASSIAASSTDNFPDESIENTLVSNEQVYTRPSYWSSVGQKDPSVPETLTYRLSSRLCVVEQINIRPFLAYFQTGDPIYSSQAVRFRMGYSLLPDEAYDGREHALSHDTGTDQHIWTYVSPIYPMEQENVLQTFVLPQPVLCIGGIVQIELLGRVQKQEMDGLYYICVCYVQAIGRLVPPCFHVDFSGESKTITLRYLPDAVSCNPDQVGSSGQSNAESAGSSGRHSFAQILRRLRGGTLNEVIITRLLDRMPVNIDIAGEGEEEVGDSDEDGVI